MTYIDATIKAGFDPRDLSSETLELCKSVFATAQGQEGVISPPEQVVGIIAECSEATAQLAGVDGTGLAGNIVSVLSANPEMIADFLDNPSGTMIDKAEKFRPEQGSLSWLAMNGQIVTPAAMRAHLGQADN